MGPTEAPRSLCGVGSCLIPVETFNRSILQIRKAQMSCLTWSWALLSPLLSPPQKIAGDTDVDSLKAGGSWTQSSSFANRFGIAFVTFSRGSGGRWEDRDRWVCQDWVWSSSWRAGRSSRAQMCFVNQSKRSCGSQSLANTGTRPWSTHGIRASLQLQQAVEFTIHVCSGSTHFQTDKYL